MAPSDPDPKPPDYELMTSRQLKALGHPVRRRIISLLTTGRPARAADLSGRLGVPANQVSFHLRTLAGAGLIEEAPEEARDRRDRVWRVHGEGFRVADGERPVEGADLAAVTAFMSNELHTQQERLRRVAEWFGSYAGGQESEKKAEWSNYTFALTQEEAQELLRELDALLRRVKRATSSRSSEDTDEGERHIWDITFLAARDDV